MKNRYKLLLLVCLFLNASATAQVSFVDEIERLDMQDFHSGVAIAISDVNGDLLDDVVRLQNGVDLYIEYQNPDGTFSSELVEAGALAESQWTLAVGDIDNNGRSEIMVGDHFFQTLWTAADGTGFKNSYTRSTLPGGGFFSQGSNFADINNDGWLDAFHCNDDAESFIWGNDGAGNLVLQNDWIDMVTGDGYDANSGNYGSTWTDFDSDGDLDLYIARCRQAVIDPNDPRRINGLYENDGNGNFTETAADYGLAVGWQTWAAEFQDVDNDGDFDCFLTNHETSSQLFENQDGMFVDVSAGSGISLNITPIQTVMKDFDNDGFVDILISGTDSEYYHNNGDLTFTKVFNLLDNRSLESFAIGDMNRDGYLDIYGGYAQLFTVPTSVDDALWINQGGDNNFLAVSLIGTDCNLDAIGARLEIFGEFGQQLREVRAGESYGINHSKTQHFGLGATETVDMLKITWPNGNVDIHENVTANQFITVIEGVCISPNVSVQVSGPTTICDGESVALTAPEGFNYEWSTGETTQTINAMAAGSYSVRITDDAGCWANSSAIEVVVNPDETPSINALSELLVCAGDAVVLRASDAESYEWSNGETTQEVMVFESGTYTVSVPGFCQTFTSTEIIVEVNDPVAEPNILTPEANTVPFTTASLEAEGDLIRWYESAEASEHLFEGPVFETPELEFDATFWVANLLVDGAELEEGGKPDFAGSGGVNSEQFNGQIIFNAFEPFTLLSIDVRTESAGERTFQVLDNGNNLITEKTVFVDFGDQTVLLDMEIPEGGQMAFRCAEHPDMYRNDGGVAYPYPIGTVGEMVNSNYGPEWYYYYYNWQIQKEGMICSSERLPVDVSVAFLGINDVAAEKFDLFPNPAQDQLNIRFATDFKVTEMKLNNLLGKTIKTVSQEAFENGNYTLEIGDIAAGVYLIQLSDGQTSFSQKVLINR